MSTKAKQWVVLTILFLWGFISFLFIVGEEAPGEQSTLGKFIIIKGCALVSLALCFLVGRWLHRKGALPEAKEV